MSDYVKSLGWYIRFVPPSQTALSGFYKETLGFPFVRAGNPQAVDFFWAGEALIFELIFEGRTEVMPEVEADPDRAPLLPLYRVTDLDALVATLRAKDVPLTPIRQNALGRECYLRDPIGCLIGMRQVDASSRLPQDMEAARRARRGEAFNPGCASMPPYWQELGWVKRHVADVNAMQQFYSSVLGLPVVAKLGDCVLLDMGDNTLLELAPGGVATTPPANRAELPATLILRIQNIAGFKQHMQRQGVRIVHDIIQWVRGSLSYIADPEGNLIGVEEKYHPGDYAGHAPFPEDLETQRRWNEIRAHRRLLAGSTNPAAEKEHNYSA